MSPFPEDLHHFRVVELFSDVDLAREAVECLRLPFGEKLHRNRAIVCSDPLDHDPHGAATKSAHDADPADSFADQVLHRELS